MNKISLKKAELDEIELYLRVLEKDYYEEIKNKTCLEIANIIQKKFMVRCNERQVFLLYEPKIEEILEDNEYYYKNIIGL